MSSGPSKEELDMYWKNSRQYFDELANFYKTSDPAYYDQFIAPYYSNPLYSATARQGGSSRGCIVIAAVIILIIGFAAAGVFFFLSMDKESENDYEPPKIEKKVGKEIDKPNIDTVKTQEPVNPKKDNNRKKRIERVR